MTTLHHEIVTHAFKYNTLLFVVANGTVVRSMYKWAIKIGDPFFFKSINILCEKVYAEK